MWDPFGPLHQGEELLVCCLADISDRVVGLERNKDTKHKLTTVPKTSLSESLKGQFTSKSKLLLMLCPTAAQ